MVSNKARQVINSIKPNLTRAPPGPTQKGSAGYDNIRDDIEKTKKLREGSIEKVPVNGNDITNKTYVDDQFPVTHASTTGQTTDDHHPQTHTIVSHDTDTTGAELTSLADNSMADTLHRHSELSASDGTPDQALFVDATGKVGIGTTNPQRKFHVHSGALDVGIRLQSTDALAKIELMDTGGTAWIAGSSGQLHLSSQGETSTGTIVIAAKSGGFSNVGINTTTPDCQLDINGALATTALSPTAVTGNTNNWAVNTNSFVRYDSDGEYNLTGIVAGVDGQRLTLANVGATKVTLQNENANSTAANRFIITTGGDCELAANGIAIMIYDATDDRWRVWCS